MRSPRFPQGLTVWEANGQWQQSNGCITQERAKVLQESVLWESARVGAAF